MDVTKILGNALDKTLTRATLDPMTGGPEGAHRLLLTFHYFNSKMLLETVAWLKVKWIQ